VQELAAWGQSQDRLEISHLIVAHVNGKVSSLYLKAITKLMDGGIIDVLKAFAWKILLLIEEAGLARVDADHTKQSDISGLVQRNLIVYPVVSKSGKVFRFSADDIARIKKLELDVLIRCGYGILRGEILHAARFGVLSFHHGDNRSYRGSPAGFWEVYNREDSTGFVIQQLTEELDGGHVLIRGTLPTKGLFLTNQAALFKTSNYYMKILLSDIARYNRLPEAEGSLPFSGPMYKEPGIRIQTQYVLKSFGSMCERLLYGKLLRREARWSVGFSKVDTSWKDLAMWRSNKIENPPGHFLADPFIITEGELSCCFVENYDYQCRRGHISAYLLKEKEAVSLGNAIVEPFHMSFPFLFRFASTIYMVPETSENGDIRLYECIEFPMKWRLKKVIMTNIFAVDTMIFKYNDLWWMFTNIDVAATGDVLSSLSIFYSTDPIAGEWLPHPKNPVIVDSSKARNGGLLFESGTAFRVGQRQGFGRYGSGASINRIVQLDVNQYVEERLCSIEPKFHDNIKGTHHLHADGNFTVFDFVEDRRTDS
jgi:hypothetical protein